MITPTSLEGRSRTVEGVDNLSLNRIIEERPTDATHYLMPCVHTIGEGMPIGGTYPGPTFIYIVEGLSCSLKQRFDDILITTGNYTVQDRVNPDKPFEVTAGDFVYVENGSLLKWTAPVTGKGKFQHYIRASYEDTNSWLAAFGVIWSPVKYWPDDIVADVSGF